MVSLFSGIPIPRRDCQVEKYIVSKKEENEMYQSLLDEEIFKKFLGPDGEVDYSKVVDDNFNAQLEKEKTEIESRAKRKFDEMMQMNKENSKKASDENKTSKSIFMPKELIRKNQDLTAKFNKQQTINNYVYQDIPIESPQLFPETPYVVDYTDERLLYLKSLLESHYPILFHPEKYPPDQFKIFEDVMTDKQKLVIIYGTLMTKNSIDNFMISDSIKFLLESSKNDWVMSFDPLWFDTCLMLVYTHIMKHDLLESVDSLNDLETKLSRIENKKKDYPTLFIRLNNLKKLQHLIQEKLDDITISYKEKMFEGVSQWKGFIIFCPILHQGHYELLTIQFDYDIKKNNQRLSNNMAAKWKVKISHFDSMMNSSRHIKKQSKDKRFALAWFIRLMFSNIMEEDEDINVCSVVTKSPQKLSLACGCFMMLYILIMSLFIPPSNFTDTTKNMGVNENVALWFYEVLLNFFSNMPLYGEKLRDMIFSEKRVREKYLIEYEKLSRSIDLNVEKGL